MPFATVNGQRLFYEDTGGSAPVLVFSHGLLMDHRMFAPQVAAFRHGWRCISWDERGHGATATPGQCAPFSYYDSANDLVALLDHLGVERAVLVGMSQGGYLSLRAALIHPQRVRALVLIDTQALKEDPAKMPAHQAVVARWSQQGLDAEMATGLERTILGDGWEGAATWKRIWQGVDVANLQQCFATLDARDDISARMGEIRAPALVIHGTQDRAITLERARAMADALPRARWVEIEGAGHAPNLTHPEPVNAAMQAFLGTLAPQG